MECKHERYRVVRVTPEDGYRVVEQKCEGCGHVWEEKVFDNDDGPVKRVERWPI